ncbi:NAD(P)-binding protein, partial [Imleria badia]
MIGISPLLPEGTSELEARRPFVITVTMTPSKIYAITIAKHGGPEVIDKTEIPFPKVEPGHIVIKVEYFGVNFIDTYFREGLYPVSKFPYVLGKEAAGVIVGLPTDPAVLNDPEYQKRGYKEGGHVAVEGSGAHAEYISMPWMTVYPVPNDVSTRTAAAILLQGLTATTFMEEAYNVQKGDVILIHTVAGGLGLLLTQVAKSRGATVIGTTSNDEKAALAKQTGADHVIIYKRENTVQKVLEITNGEGVNAIYDGVGKDTFDSDFEMLRRKGTLVSVGNASGAVPPFAPLRLSQKNLKLVRPVMGNYTYTASEAFYYSNEVWGLIEKGALKPIIHKEYPFTAESVREAQSDLAGGKTVGKLVVKVSQ